MKKTIMKIVEFSVNKPKLVILLTIFLSALFAIQFPKIKIDTDPENMLREDAPIRVFHQEAERDGPRSGNLTKTITCTYRSGMNFKICS
jgi:predicted RND superfamily exporter protein